MIENSGSYNKDDVTFLLKLIDINEESIENKEKLIQNNQKHYSEMISPEYIPTTEYMKVFEESMKLNSKKVAEQVIQLSHFIDKYYKKPIIVSLVRAGTPIGVLLNRTLKNVFKKDSKHYSISIIRDKGIDENALKYILKHESELTGIPEKILSTSIIFVDGWTGKGVINKELKESVENFNNKYNSKINSDLYVLADISGKSDISATHEDYFIPSAALNSTISGLISRSILNKDFIFENDFHGCKFYEEFKPYDKSLWYIETISEEIIKIFENEKEFNSLKFIKNDKLEKEQLSEKSKHFLEDTMKKLKIYNINFIKPGICETTRVLLRRVPDLILVKDLNDLDVKHILKLAEDKGVKILEIKSLPYTTVGIIKELD
jgi:hypothetical protein